VTALNGEAQVTDEGYIVYVFPDLQLSASSGSPSSSRYADDNRVIEERELQFSVAPELNRVLAAGLGVLNLGGALYLGNLLGQYTQHLPSYMGLVQQGYPLLLLYAILLNVIPAVRYIWVQRQNWKIAARNEVRLDWKVALERALTQTASLNSPLGRKLKAAAQMGSQMRLLKSADIVYDTSKPMEDNQRKKEDQAMQEFDKLLENDAGFQ
jgi:hypothetical protein